MIIWAAVLGTRDNLDNNDKPHHPDNLDNPANPDNL